MSWCKLALWLLAARPLHAAFAEGHCPEAVQGRALLQRYGALTKTSQVPVVPLKDWRAADFPERGVETSPQMLVFVMLILMCLLCALVEGIGRFLAHAMSFCLGSADGQPEPPTSDAADKDLTVLGPVRLIGAMHLVFYNFGPPAWAGFNAWGASWFSLYFILSGLGGAHLKLQRNAAATLWPSRQSLMRHLAIVYPLYMLALSWSLVNAWVLHQEQIRPVDLVFEALLLQSFLPQRFLHRLNGPGWFFSALAFCWLLENALFSLGKWAWERGRLTQRLTCLAVAGWVILWPFAAPGKLVSLEDNVPALSFIHCYFCGVLMAYCLRNDPQEPPGKSSKISGTGAALLLTAAFGIGDQPTAEAWSRFLLLPVQCLLIYSLVRDDDPLARLCTIWPIPLISELAIGIYVFQAPAKALLDSRMGWTGEYALQQTLLLLMLLAIVAALSQQFLQKPLAQWLTK